MLAPVWRCRSPWVQLSSCWGMLCSPSSTMQLVLLARSRAVQGPGAQPSFRGAGVPPPHHGVPGRAASHFSWHGDSGPCPALWLSLSSPGPQTPTRVPRGWQKTLELEAMHRRETTSTNQPPLGLSFSASVGEGAAGSWAEEGAKLVAWCPKPEGLHRVCWEAKHRKILFPNSDVQLYLKAQSNPTAKELARMIPAQSYWSLGSHHQGWLGPTPLHEILHLWPFSQALAFIPSFSLCKGREFKD